MPADAEWKRELETERRMRDEFMLRHVESPFVAGRVPFHPLRYFPVDPKFRLTATLERAATPEEAYLRTNRDNQAVMRYLGDLVFRLGKERHRLRVFHAGEGVGTSVFVPFRDRTSGRESYGGGRYLTLELNESDEYDLDFNRAFNPYCAYTEEYECSLPPTENTLAAEVRAGEKEWRADVPAPAERPTGAGGRSRSPRGRTARRPPRGSTRARASSPSRRRAPSRAGSARRSGR